MRRFKRRERSRPSRLILAILEVISVRGDAGDTGGRQAGREGGRWAQRGESAGDESGGKLGRSNGTPGERREQEMARNMAVTASRQEGGRGWGEDKLLFEDFLNAPRESYTSKTNSTPGGVDTI